MCIVPVGWIPEKMTFLSWESCRGKMGDIYLSFILFSLYLNIKFLLGKKIMNLNQLIFPHLSWRRKGVGKGKGDRLEGVGKDNGVMA